MDSDYVIKLLRDHGLKVTPQRIAILRLLITSGHVTINQLLSEVKKVEPTISVSTVYTTLNTLMKVGIVRSFEANGVTWYEVKARPHVNVICENLGKVIDVYDIDLTWIENKLRSSGVKVKDIMVIIHGICENKLDESSSE